MHLQQTQFNDLSSPVNMHKEPPQELCCGVDCTASATVCTACYFNQMLLPPVCFAWYDPYAAFELSDGQLLHQI